MGNVIRHSSTTLLTCVIAAAVTVLAGCERDSPSTPTGIRPFGQAGASTRSTGPLAFTSTRNGRSQIFLANADGSQPTLLAEGERPAWSADGTRLAFQSSAPSPDIQVINADGTGLRQLGKGTAPSWSPDGRKLAFAQGTAGTIFVMNDDGSGRTAIASPGFRNPDDGLRTLVWSPDGQHIAFVAASFEDVSEVFLAALAGGSPRVLVAGTNRNTQSEPAWSPDGSSMVLVHVRSVHTVRRDGSGWRSEVDGDAYDPDWAPGGEFVFSRFLSGFGPGSPMRIFIGRGSTARQLVPDVAGVAAGYWDHQPAWARR
jgi:TolB protein